MHKPIVIASRQSPLAVAQAVAVRAMLGRAARLPESAWETAFPLKTYVTSGDKNLQDTLADAGGKGLFVKEVEAALLSGEADIAVHSMKDMPAVMPEGLALAAVPPREDPRDAFVSLHGTSLMDLAEGAIVGTSSVRRAAQLLRLRPDLHVVPFRGNVQTRLAKLTGGVADGTFLAEAGLRRLGRDDVARQVMEPSHMLPALGQGVLCVQARSDDAETLERTATIACEQTAAASAVERAFLARLDGSCRTPMAGLAVVEDDTIRFRAEIISPDGKLAESSDLALPMGTAAELDEAGRSCADALLSAASPELRDVLKSA